MRLTRAADFWRFCPLSESSSWRSARGARARVGRLLALTRTCAVVPSSGWASPPSCWDRRQWPARSAKLKLNRSPASGRARCSWRRIVKRLLPGLVADLKRLKSDGGPQRAIALLSAYVAMIAASGGQVPRVAIMVDTGAGRRRRVRRFACRCVRRGAAGLTGAVCRSRPSSGPDALGVRASPDERAVRGPDARPWHRRQGFGRDGSSARREGGSGSAGEDIRATAPPCHPREDRCRRLGGRSPPPHALLCRRVLRDQRWRGRSRCGTRAVLARHVETSCAGQASSGGGRG